MATRWQPSTRKVHAGRAEHDGCTKMRGHSQEGVTPRPPPPPPDIGANSGCGARLSWNSRSIIVVSRLARGQKGFSRGWVHEGR